MPVATVSAVPASDSGKASDRSFVAMARTLQEEFERH